MKSNRSARKRGGDVDKRKQEEQVAVMVLGRMLV